MKYNKLEIAKIALLILILGISILSIYFQTKNINSIEVDGYSRGVNELVSYQTLNSKIVLYTSDNQTKVYEIKDICANLNG